MLRARMIAVSIAVFGLSLLVSGGQAQKSSTTFAPVIPKTWDDEAIATLEVPLADPIGSPKHVSSDYYYRIPVAPIYKTYPIYAPGHEPPGYIDRLKGQEPVMVWDDAGHAPPLKTEADWIKAGEVVFDAPINFGGIVTIADTRDPAWYKELSTPVAA